MSNAMQAFLLTAGLFTLSFVAIFVMWFADRLRSDYLLGKRQRDLQRRDAAPWMR
jgi:hypothetical protein